MRKSGADRKFVSALLGKADALFQSAVIFLIQSYRVLISPHFGNCCRFYPSCSVYAQEAVRTHGIFYGIFLAFKRLLKCQPYHPGGIDAVQSRT